MGPGSAKLYQRSDYSRYDSAGNVVKFKDRVRYPDSRLSTSATYQYDGLGRLTSAKRKEGTLALAYDGLGNMTAGNQFTFEYNATSHPHWVTGLSEAGLITHYPSGAVAYIDALDAMTQDRLFTYDADGRLTRVWRTVGPTVYYVYDFRGDRVARYVEGVPLPQAFTFSLGRWFDRRGSTVTRHIYLADRRIAESPATGGGPRYPVDFVISDHLGSTLGLTCWKFNSTACPDRSVARGFSYDAYGKPTAYQGTTTVSLGTSLPGNFVPEKLYTGQRWDHAARLYYYGARFYDPTIASFLTLDPVRQHMNPYAYVGWNPVAFTDPTGMIFGLIGIGAFSGSVGKDDPILLAGYAATVKARAPGHGGFNGPNGAGPGGGFGGDGGGLAQALANFAISQAQAAIEGTARQQGGAATASHPVLNASLQSGEPLNAGDVRPGPVIFDVSEPGGLWGPGAPFADSMLGNASSAPSSLTDSAPTVSPGYVDASVTVGVAYARTVGFTTGVMFAKEAYFAYLGPAAMFPTGGPSFTRSEFSTASSGWNIALQGSIWLTVQVGYSFGSGPFLEYGSGTPGVSLSAFYVAGPLGYQKR